MKKIVLCFLCMIMLFGCDDFNSLKDCEENKLELKNENSEKTSTDNIKESGIQIICSKVYKAENLTRKVFEKNGFPNPTMIHCFIGENKMDIGFIYDYELNLDKNERNQNYQKDLLGTPYIYYGSMSQLTETVYSVKGSYPHSWEDTIKKVSDEIDFYLVFNKDELYFVFGDRPIEELENIYPASFAKFISEYDEYFENCESCFTKRIWNVEIEHKPSNYAAGIRTDDYFESKGLWGPSAIDLFIGENNQFIGFIYLYDILATEEDILETPKDEFGNSYVYYGKMTKITDSIYNVKGDFMPSWRNQVPKVSEDIDFYVKLDYDKLFIIFDDCTMEELMYYDSQSFALFYKYY